MSIETESADRIPAAHGLEFSSEEYAAMIRAVLSLFEKWQLTDSKARVLLGRPAPRTFARWKQGRIGRPSFDTACRMSYLLGIHKALRYLFKDPARGYAWIRKPNLAFGGQSALERMSAGEITDIAAVRSYLDAERGGW